MKTRTTLGMISTAAMLMFLLAVPAIAGPGNGNHLAGTWEVIGSPDPASGIPEFLNLSLISKEGTIINEDPAEGTSLGGWNFEGKNRYSIKFYGFIPAANLRHSVTSEVTLGNSGDTFSGPFRSDVFDMQGTFLFSFEGQVNATRLPTP